MAQQLEPFMNKLPPNYEQELETNAKENIIVNYALDNGFISLDYQYLSINNDNVLSNFKFLSSTICVVENIFIV